MHKPLHSWQADRHISQPRERASDRLPHQRHDENQDNQVISGAFTRTDLFEYLKVFSFVLKYALRGSFTRKHAAKTLANRSWHLITAPSLKTPFNQLLNPRHTVHQCASVHPRFRSKAPPCQIIPPSSPTCHACKSDPGTNSAGKKPQPDKEVPFFKK